MYALVLTALFETLGFGPRPMECVFRDTAVDPVEIRMTARPSLKDMPGLYRVELRIDDRLTLKGAAQPISSTEARDVIIRARHGKARVYTVGIDHNGFAALSVTDAGDPEESPVQSTQTGTCSNHERYIDRWLTS